MLSNFQHLFPEVIFDAAECLGGRCTGRYLALNAMENRVYDIEREDQENVIIKFYRPGRWSRETILAEHRFLKACEQNEVPVVYPVEDEKGETLFEIQNTFFSLFPKKPGRLEPELTKEQLERLGRYLARIHNAGTTLKDVPRGRLDAQNYGRNSVAYLMKEDLLPLGLGKNYEQIVLQACDLMEPLFKKVPFILTHGDCHAGNVLWNGNSPHFIDFDDMLFAPAVQDFWMLIGGDDEIARENRDILTDSYLKMRDFNENEFGLIEPLRTLRMIYFSTWIARRRDDGAFKAAFPHFGTEKYWQEQIEHLSLQLEKLRESSNH